MRSEGLHGINEICFKSEVSLKLRVYRWMLSFILIWKYIPLSFPDNAKGSSLMKQMVFGVATAVELLSFITPKNKPQDLNASLTSVYERTFPELGKNNYDV